MPPSNAGIDDVHLGHIATIHNFAQPKISLHCKSFLTEIFKLRSVICKVSD